MPTPSPTIPGPEVRARAIGILTSNTGTQNSDAFDTAMAAISAGGAQHWVFDPGKYHFSRTLKITRPVRLTGVGFQSDIGTHLIFPAAVGGIHIARYSDADGSGASASVEHMRITGGYAFLGPSGTAHGIEMESTAQAHQCHIEFFDGDGFYVHAFATGGAPANANSFYATRLSINGCGANGIHTYGSDANAGVFQACVISSCPQAVLEDSYLGNFYFGCTSDGNTRGFKSLGVEDGAFNKSTFLGCYAEGGFPVDLGGNASWFGGTINEGVTALGAGLTIIAGTVSGKGLSFQFTNKEGTSTGKAVVGSGNSASGNVLSFLPAATSDDGIVNYRQTDGVQCGWDKSASVSRSWTMFGLGDGTLPPVSFTGTDSVHRYWPMQLPGDRMVVEGNEYWLGPNRHASRADVPNAYTDHEQTFNIGDVIWNRNVAAGGKIGWVCTGHGTIGQYTDVDHQALGTYAEGRTATADGTTTVVLNGLSSVLLVGMLLLINGVDSNRIQEKHTVGGVTTLVMTYAVPAGAGLAITFHAPTFKTWGSVDS